MPPAALSRSTNSSPAILCIAPVAANAPVNDSVEPTTIGAVLVEPPLVLSFFVLQAVMPVAPATSATTATTDGMRVRMSFPLISARCRRPIRRGR